MTARSSFYVSAQTVRPEIVSDRSSASSFPPFCQQETAETAAKNKKRLYTEVCVIPCMPVICQILSLPYITAIQILLLLRSMRRLVFRSTSASSLSGTGSLRPGIGVSRSLPAAGDIHITGIVNHSGSNNHLTLQTTKLLTVAELARLHHTGNPERITCPSFPPEPAEASPHRYTLNRRPPERRLQFG